MSNTVERSIAPVARKPSALYESFAIGRPTRPSTSACAGTAVWWAIAARANAALVRAQVLGELLEEALRVKTAP
jgi:hypothetical protein